MDVFFGGGGAREGTKSFSSSSSGSLALLRRTLDATQTRIATLEQKRTAELRAAKLKQTSKRQEAVSHLKRAKRLEEQLRKLRETETSLEYQIFAIEDIDLTRDRFHATREGLSAMKTATSTAGITVDAVNDLSAEMREQQRVMEEMDSIIKMPVFGDEAVDDAELFAQLDDMEEATEAADAQSASTDLLDRAPHVPDDDVDHEDLARLASSLAL